MNNNGSARDGNDHEALIRGEVPNLPKSLSGPHANVAKKLLVFVSFLQFGLQWLDDLITPMNYTFSFTSLLSCLTLDVENCHSVVHHKPLSALFLNMQGQCRLMVERKIGYSCEFHTFDK